MPGFPHVLVPLFADAADAEQVVSVYVLEDVMGEELFGQDGEFGLGIEVDGVLVLYCEVVFVAHFHGDVPF